MAPGTIVARAWKAPSSPPPQSSGSGSPPRLPFLPPWTACVPPAFFPATPALAGACVEDPPGRISPGFFFAQFGPRASRPHSPLPDPPAPSHAPYHPPGCVESFHSRSRDELLNVTEFESLRQARQCATAWREDYNDYRPHSSLGGVSPAEYARRCVACVPAAPPLQQHSDLSPFPQPILS
ncbi:MAG: integrase core domain-containing protein [Pirellula sp.]